MFHSEATVVYITVCSYFGIYTNAKLELEDLVVLEDQGGKSRICLLSLSIIGIGIGTKMVADL